MERWTRIYRIAVIVLLAVIAAEGFLILRSISYVGNGIAQLSGGFVIYPPMQKAK